MDNFVVDGKIKKQDMYIYENLKMMIEFMQQIGLNIKDLDVCLYNNRFFWILTSIKCVQTREYFLIVIGPVAFLYMINQAIMEFKLLVHYQNPKNKEHFGFYVSNVPHSTIHKYITEITNPKQCKFDMGKQKDINPRSLNILDAIRRSLFVSVILL